MRVFSASCSSGQGRNKLVDPVQVGLVGAGPHAVDFHAPMWATGPETRLAAWWGGRRAIDSRLAARHSTRAVHSYQELLEIVDAVVLAVPPAAQWVYAIEAARAGRHVVLEKPLADSLAHAREVAAAIESEGVSSVLLLTARFSDPVAAGLARAADLDIVGVRGVVSTNLLLDGLASPWRRTSGALLDLGPHLVDLALEALGRAVSVTANVSHRGWVDLQIDHVNGGRSNLAVTGHASELATRFTVEFYGSDGLVELDVWGSLDLPKVMSRVRANLEDAVHGRHVASDVNLGVAIQEVLEAAQSSIGSGRRCDVGGG